MAPIRSHSSNTFGKTLNSFSSYCLTHKMLSFISVSRLWRSIAWCFLPVLRLFRYHILPPLLDFSLPSVLLIFSYNASLWLYWYLQPEAVLTLPLSWLLNILSITSDRYLACYSVYTPNHWVLDSFTTGQALRLLFWR